jgi:putative ABC transport system permease protein
MSAQRRSGGGPGAGRPRARAVALAIVRLASVLVPSGRRADWLAEWRGELWGRAAGRGALLGPALGAFPHACVLRAESVRHVVIRHVSDLKYALRALARRPSFALPAILTLALGVGATTAVYSVVDAVLLAPLPYPEADRFVAVRARVIEWGSEIALSDELLAEWRNRQRGLDVLEAYLARRSHLVGAGTPLVATQMRVTDGFLTRLLGVRPLAGRLFDAEEATGTGPAVTLLSERVWRGRFDARPGVAGTVVRVDGQPMEIIGVVPTIDFLPAADLWTPYTPRPDHSRTVLGSYRAIGRLSSDWSRARAENALREIHAMAAVEHPASLGPFEPVLADFRETLVSDVRARVILLFGTVIAVLLIASVNVANLLLARTVERAPEMVVRTSLGAGRGHLVSQVLAESLIVALLGGVLGALTGWVTLHGLLGILPAEIPLGTSIGLDLRVLGFAAAATLGAALLTAVLPMMRVTRAARIDAGRATATRGQRRTSAWLLGLEVTQAGALLVAAGLMLTSLLRMTSAPVGFDSDGLVFVHLDLPDRDFAAAADPMRRARFMDDLRSAVRQIDGVTAIGIGTATPFSGATFVTRAESEGGIPAGRGDAGISVTGDHEHLHFSRLHVDPDYLAALGLPIVAGRAFLARDFDGADRVALVNETAARAYWPDGGPLGRRIREPGGEWTTIVGVVADFGHPGLPAKDMAEFYLPLAPHVLSSPSFARPTALVRFDHSTTATSVERIRSTIWSLDPDLALPAISTARDELGARLAEPRFYAVLLGAFSGLALLLAAVGVYGVVTHSVARRTREIGIRMALGAPAGAVRRLIVRQSLRVVAIGVVLGLFVGAAASRLLQGLLFGVEPNDPATFVSVAALLLAVAAAAAWIPARRALRADPLRALRAD